MKPLCVDLYSGLGGWTEGFLSEDYDVVGFDIERHVYGGHYYPGQLVLQDVLTLHGAQLRDADIIVASPPCQGYSYMAMPWTRAKQLAAWYRESPVRTTELNALFDACFRIQLEASKAAGRYIPLIIENVKGAQPWVGSAKWHYGSYYLWGDVPALMPVVPSRQVMKRGIAHRSDKPGYKAEAFNTTAQKRLSESGDVKTVGHINQRDGHAHTRHLTNQSESDAVKNGGNGTWFGKSHGVEYPGQPGNADGVKQGGSGPDWFDKALDERRKQATKDNDGRKLDADAYQEGAVIPDGTGQTSWFFGNTKHELRTKSSGSNARKQASAMIAKIPFPLASYIARVFKPQQKRATA